MKSRKVLVEVKNDKVMNLLQNLEDNNLLKLLGSTKDEGNINGTTILKPKRKSETESFFDLKGIWENRDVTLETIRAKAWPKRNR